MTRRQKERRVRALVEHWRTPLGLAAWAFDLRFDDTIPEQASCIAMPEYRKAQLYFNLKRLSEDELDETVLHEMLHCLGWPLAALAQLWAGKKADRMEVVRAAEEMLITHLSNVMLPLLPRVISG